MMKVIKTEEVGMYEDHNQRSEDGGRQVNFIMNEMKPTPLKATTSFISASSSSQQPLEFQVKETRPPLRGKRVEKPVSTYDLVEEVEYLFVRIVKARDLPVKDVSGSIDPYVELRFGNNRATTRHMVKMQNPEWDDVFAFPVERLQAVVLEAVVRDKSVIKDDSVGRVVFDLTEVPQRAPPDSPLAPEWYFLMDSKGERAKEGELMAAVWFGTQADECFPIALHSGSTGLSFNSLIRSKVYHSPRLWYLRANVIEAQDVVIPDKTRFPDLFVKCQLGAQILRTKTVQVRATANPHPLWNEDLVFVAAEPFEEALILSLHDHVGPNKDETVGRVQIQLSGVEKRLEGKPVDSKWYSLEKHGVNQGGEKERRDRFFSRLHLRLSLDGGYHVLDDSTHCSSDLRPAARQLWKPHIGLLELGILRAEGLQAMKKGTCDSYCVAKYGQKWVRTRTVMNSLSPKYNEQYTWEVYDHATVLLVAVFDNSQLDKKGAEEGSSKDARMGKVRIRVSSLESGRVYTHWYPLLVLQSSGIKKMGELHLAIRFSSTSLFQTMMMYSKPLLPKLHYTRPLSMMQLEILRRHTVAIVAERLGRMEPPLRREVVEYLSDVDSHLWSMRRSKANFYRLMSLFSGPLAVGKWLGDVCLWKNPVTTVLVHILFVMLVCFPELIVPTAFLYAFLIGVWNYRRRPRNPPHLNTRASQADSANPDELDEEFDAFPSTKNQDVLRMRYDRLRTVAGRMQAVAGDTAMQGERLQLLLSWRDPRATAIFLAFCLLAAFVLYITPFSLLAVLCGFYLMRHPKFRHKMPPPPLNFFRRLPARSDSML